jgi:hypothetical protein
MRVLDYSPIPFDGGNLSFQERLSGIAKFGFSWVQEMKSQEVIVELLNKVLDNHYTLLRNIPLPNGVVVPLVLLGPHGITVLYNSITKGMFRAEGDSWESMNNRSRDFKPARPNLITRTIRLAQIFEDFLKEMGQSKDIDGVLVFTDPGSHVNSNRPAVRIILLDAIDRFGASLLQRQQVMTVAEIRNLIEAITEALQPEEIKQESDIIVPYQQFADNVDSGFLKALAPIQEKLNFNRQQWVLLGLFALVDVIVLVLFVLYILWTA